MSLSVAYNQNLSKGIDSTALKSVTQEIFKRAEAKTTVDLTKADLSKFKRADLGMDLYAGKVDSKTAKQVAMTNSGMQVTLNEQAASSLKFLNSQAAAKAVTKRVEGKMAPAINEAPQEVKKTFSLPNFTKLVKTSDLSQDKRGSNPFYKGELLKVQKTEETEEQNNMNINIFA